MQSRCGRGVLGHFITHESSSFLGVDKSSTRPVQFHVKGGIDNIILFSFAIAVLDILSFSNILKVKDAPCQTRDIVIF